MAKIKVVVNKGRVLDLVNKSYTEGDELLMNENDAEPILGTCIDRVVKEEKEFDPDPVKPIDRPVKPAPKEDEKKTV